MKAEAENARLREALEQIANFQIKVRNPRPDITDFEAKNLFGAAWVDCREIARAALEPKP